MTCSWRRQDEGRFGFSILWYRMQFAGSKSSSSLRCTVSSVSWNCGVWPKPSALSAIDKGHGTDDKARSVDAETEDKMRSRQIVLFNVKWGTLIEATNK